VLVDKAPRGLHERVESIVGEILEVKRFHDIKVREAGQNKFIELNIHVDKNMTIEQAHEISHRVEEAISSQIQNVKVMVHAEPESL